ncbi:hypothetical protein N7486_004733 [Penicillium sp. IBT 16267x]|nr:hypothetical protein N7486_004733 [Penicillium sp. IBT 16267x]
MSLLSTTSSAFLTLVSTGLLRGRHSLLIHIIVRDTRLQVGIKDAPPLLTLGNSPIPETTANGLRGSYRLLPTPKKRSRVDYTGLNRPSKRRKSKTARRKTIPPKTTPSPIEACAAASSSLQTALPLSVFESLSPADSHESQPAVEISAYRAETVPHDIVEKILINYIKLNDPLGGYGHRTKQTTITTRIEKIQSFEIIKKGAELLDPENLPTPKGPLDEFTVAKNVATERSIRKAGYRLSLAN